MSLPILSAVLANEMDIALARRRARELAELLGFDTGGQTRIATAVSEIARNAFQYTGGGRVEFHIEGSQAPQLLLVRISDRGGGIKDLEGVLAGRYTSKTGMGLGISGARRLVDQFEIQSSARGTVVVLKKMLPSSAPYWDGERIQALSGELLTRKPAGPYEELQRQNQELLQALEEIRRQQEKLALLNSELEDTNRGVLALYAELDEKADHLRRADELKSRFLSNMSHEFRTPLNSITALTNLLLGRADGEINEEQEHQLQMVRKAAQGLSELVNDLLDIAKVEAGKIVVRPAEFEVAGLFGALRGMLRPLMVSDRVAMVFQEPKGIPPLTTDEGKVSQILRNFISNAIKFTEQGEIRVSAAWDPKADTVTFWVADTGIGIAKADQERIFEEFGQLENPIQKNVKGTGLGLPLSRQLARLLGGSLSVQSELGAGSTFSAVIPVSYVPASPEPAAPPIEVDPGLIPVLAVEDNPDTLFTLGKYLKNSAFQLIPAQTIAEARRLLRRHRPAAILLDIMLPGEDAWVMLAELKGDPETAKTPVIVTTTVEDDRKAYALGADAFLRKPVERAVLLGKLTELTAHGRQPVLIIDDDEAFRYLLRRSIGPRLVLEASGGAEGVSMAREFAPRMVFLDLMMPGMTGWDVLDALRAEPRTASLPVVVVSSRVLGREEAAALESQVLAFIPKGEISQERIGAALRLAAKPGGTGNGD